MPRPGPRPYECVRRAWHSDRHQPIRGSLTQEIFRVASEIHGSATKKNKEWQEKLPFVVLKAEEIMYSKANSEAEYMDLTTLCSRVNDAINTIIRLDESSETDNLLPPCIEAALHLGCTPRRTSRSQRNVNPRCYLSPTAQDPNTTGIFENTTPGNNSTNLQNISCFPNFVKPALGKSTLPAYESHCPVAQNSSCTTTKFSFSTRTKTNTLFPYSSSKGISSYPLYYGNYLPSKEPPCDSVVLSNFNPSNTGPALTGTVPKYSSSKVDVSNKEIKLDLSKSPESDCDLSLRLGPCLVSCSGIENNQLRKVKEVSKINGMSLPSNKFIFPVGIGDDLSCSSSKWISESEHMSMQAKRKRKAPSSQRLEDQELCWQAKPPYNHFDGNTKNAGF